jgi:apolipoprotein D and lipocalin family protein
MNKLIILFAAVLLLSCSADMKKLETVKRVELDRYLGKWYEIVRLPNRFEKGLVCVTAEYSMRDDGKIKVVNAGHKEEDLNEKDVATGKAWIPDTNHPGQLKVQFFWPFRGDYYIFHLDTINYEYALVGSPSRKYFWLLSRKPVIADGRYQELISIAEEHGFDSSAFYKTPQVCH